jgi:hypothetical protein
VHGVMAIFMMRMASTDVSRATDQYAYRWRDI